MTTGVELDAPPMSWCGSAWAFVDACSEAPGLRVLRMAPMDRPLSFQPPRALEAHHQASGRKVRVAPEALALWPWCAVSSSASPVPASSPLAAAAPRGARRHLNSRESAKPRFPDCYRLFWIFQTLLGDFTPDRLDSRSLQTLWELKNRVLLEEYYIFNVVIPLEVE